MLERIKSALAGLASNFWATLLKLVIVAAIAFSVFIVIKYFKVFSSTVEVAIADVNRELDAVHVESLLNPQQQTATSAFFKSFLMVVLTIGKVIAMVTTTFVSFFVIEAHSVLPTTVLCFIYGGVIGLVGGYYYGRGRLPSILEIFRRRRGRNKSLSPSRVYIGGTPDGDDTR
jgi:hypothetical protein